MKNQMHRLESDAHARAFWSDNVPGLRWLANQGNGNFPYVSAYLLLAHQYQSQGRALLANVQIMLLARVARF